MSDEDWGAPPPWTTDPVVDGDPLDTAPGNAVEDVEPRASSGEEPIEFDPVMLAAEVSRIGADLGALNDLLTHEENGLLAQVREHDEALGAILDLLSAQPGGPWLWTKLGPEPLRALWQQLGEWVAWLEDRYLVNLPASDFDLPACWWQHPIAVELLTALMVAHHATYAQKAVLPSFTLVEWHTRALEPVFAAMKAMKVFTACADGGHTAPSRRPRHDAGRFASWVDEVAPEPVGAQEDA